MAYLMGIDIGSTSIKAVVYDERGQMISEGSKPSERSFLDDTHKTWSVWEPQKIWQAVCDATQQAMSKLTDKQSVLGVAVTGFGMDGLPISADGQSLYPFISWHCPRTNEIAEKFSNKFGQDYIFDISGGQFMAIHSVYRMMWMQENHPEIIEKTEKWLLIEDYINFMLCGEMATDFSMGWNTSLLNQKAGVWSDELVEKAGIPKRILPDIKQSGTVLGNVSANAQKQTGLSSSTKVVLGGHDYICAALAVGAVDDDVVMDVTGTWEMIVQASSTLSHDRRIFDSGYYVENHVAKDKYCFVASTVSGDMTEWFKDNLSFEELQIEKNEGVNVWRSLMDKAKRSSAGANGCFFLPHFSGAGTPTLDPN
jgi:sugar (pentulose or hexulose) kinase